MEWLVNKRAEGIANVIKSGLKSISRPYYKRHADDEFCDEIRLKVIPRFKTSGMSGDEWRTSVKVQLFRKGFMYAETSVSKMEYAIMMLGHFYVTSHEPVPTEAIEHEKTKCDQPGCGDDAVNHYRFKVEKHGNSGHTSPVREDREVRCKFCARHSERGDSDLEDNDENLVLMQGNGVARPHEEDESPAQLQVVDLTKDK